MSAVTSKALMFRPVAAGKLCVLRDRLFEPVDAASLVVFRVGFGVIMLWEVWRYFDHGWIERYYIEPEFFFKYYGFEWVQPWAGDGMYIHFAVLGLLAVCIAAGFAFRIAIVLFALAFSYVFLLDQTRYLNHFYLVILVAFLMCVLPANRAYSIDALLRPSMSSATVPAWVVSSLRLQFEVLYLYAGIVKVNADWLRLEPLGMWLAKRSDFPIIGPLFTETWVVGIAAYGVILLHIVGAPLLLWRRTRLWVFLIYALFHMMNHFLFQIGIFPWFTLLGTLIFFEPDWPRRVKAAVLSRFAPPHGRPEALERPAPLRPSTSPLTQNLIVGLLGVWLAFQILVPLRHVLYPGNVSWTEEGHRFSWQMKLRSKKGKAEFEVRDPVTGYTWEADSRNFLTRKQSRKMTCRPDMLLQFAHHLAHVWATQRGIPDVEVRANVKCSLNGRRRVLLIDPERDLAMVERDLGHADWILPLMEPLRRTDQ